MDERKIPEGYSLIYLPLKGTYIIGSFFAGFVLYYGMREYKKTQRQGR